MGKKGSWFAAIKRVFVSHSKDKPVNESEEKRDKKKNKGPGRARHVERKSFIPLFREPSSIEKILGEAEREHNIVFRPPTPTPTPPPLEQPKAPSIDPSPLPPPLSLPTPSHPPPRVASPRPPSPRAPSPRAVSPRAASPRITNYPRETSFRPEPTLRNHHASATKIQAAYRGYMARRSFRALRGLMRLQGVVRGQSVKRQTMSAMKYMQLLVRVQSQIQSRRIQMLENQARQQAQQRADKEVESTLGKWSLASEAGNEDWDDSVLTKEEVDTRLQRKIDAVIKRERAMAYAYSHQLWKSTPKSTQTVSDLRSGGYPWWWNWLEKQLPQQTPIENHQAAKSYRLTPPRPNSEFRPSPRPVLGTNNNGSNSNRHQHNLGFENIESGTPRSTRSSVLVPSSRFARTPPPFGGISVSKYSRPRGGAGDQSPFDAPLKDDDSLVSCPPFSVPNYMTPTVSAKAKARPSSNPKERFPGTPGSESSRRSSFPLTQGAGSFKWNKASFFSGNDSSSQRVKGLDKNQSLHSIGNLSVDSTVSLPAGVGRKPFNRFV